MSLHERGAYRGHRLHQRFRHSAVVLNRTREISVLEARVFASDTHIFRSFRVRNHSYN